MGKKRKARNRALMPIRELPEIMQLHLERLRLGSIEAYLDWCRANGFAARWTKSVQQQRDELDQFAQNRVNSEFRRARRMRRPERMLADILDERLDRAEDGELTAELQFLARTLQDASRDQRKFTRELIRHVAGCCKSFVFERTVGHEVYLHALVRLGEAHCHAVRPIADWQPRTHNNARRFASLARHLYAQWDVPAFLDRAWVENDTLAQDARGWFVHIGAGGNMRTATNLPIEFTKRTAHHFVQAPASSTLREGLRWGQVLALGGDAHLFAAFRGTRITESFENEEFWSTVVRFFVRNPMLDTVHVGPIIDYLNNQRFVEERYVDGNGNQRTIPPPQPNLSMAGRTPTTLLRQVHAWHVALGRARRNLTDAAWPASGFAAFRHEEHDKLGRLEAVYRIRELCSAAELRAEGSAMGHCVASYAYSCAGGSTSIWTLEAERKRRTKTLLTIEVQNRTGQIVQARGQFNARPKAIASRMMTRWAASSGLKIADWV